MSSLREIRFPIDLDTSSFDVAEVLFNPGLASSVTYDRGVGFFSSGWLRNVAKGLSAFAERGGKVRLIASPILSAKDVAALKEGEDLKRNSAVLAALRVAIVDIEKSIHDRPLSVLSWMIADGLLDIKLAIPVNKLDGDFHTKVGIFIDETGDYAVFHGSQNESDRGFRNFETLSVFLSWEGGRDSERALSHRQRFEDLWHQRNANVRCFDLPTAERKRIIEIANFSDRPYTKPKSKASTDSRKWRHQNEALTAFLKEGNGILVMATGTGKTRTALKIENELRERNLSQTTIVAAYGTDLLNQWYDALLEHGSSTHIYRDYNSYSEAQGFVSNHEDATLLINRRNLAKVIPYLQKNVLEQTLIICDEVHGFGEAGLVKALTGELQKFHYRLGLSATPSREYDDEGNIFIESEIGSPIFRLALDEAIRRGILCEFDYIPLEYQLSDDDRADLQKAFRRYAMRVGEGNPDKTHLFMDLAKVKKLSREKIPKFDAYVDRHPEILERCIIFVEEATYGALLQDRLTRLGVKFHTYYGGDDGENLNRFARGELDCIIACKRISEGIDIKSVKNIVLFATAKAPIETVQRVGRCLRTDPSNPNKRATVVDFIKVEDDDADEGGPFGSTDDERRSWFERMALTKTEEG